MASTDPYAYPFHVGNWIHLFIGAYPFCSQDHNSISLLNLIQTGPICGIVSSSIASILIVNACHDCSEQVGTTSQRKSGRGATRIYSIFVYLSVDYSSGAYWIEIFSHQPRREIVPAEACISGTNKKSEHQHHNTGILRHQQTYFVCGNLIEFFIIRSKNNPLIPKLQLISLETDGVRLLHVHVDIHPVLPRLRKPFVICPITNNSYHHFGYTC